MKKLAICAVGTVLLLLMEVGYSVALQRYELPASRSAFFKGPITATVSEMLDRESPRALASRGIERDGRTSAHARRPIQAAERRATRETSLRLPVSDAAALPH